MAMSASAKAALEAPERQVLPVHASGPKPTRAPRLRPVSSTRSLVREKVPAGPHPGRPFAFPHPDDSTISRVASGLPVEVVVDEFIAEFAVGVVLVLEGNEFVVSGVAGFECGGRDSEELCPMGTRIEWG